MKHDSVYLAHIIESIDMIGRYTDGMSKDVFLEDSKSCDAVIRHVEIIGEAVKAISEKTRNAYPEIPWQDIARTRDKLIHHYFDVDAKELWKIVEIDLPLLLVAIRKIQEKKDGQ